jgi:hypothetical protein
MAWLKSLRETPKMKNSKFQARRASPPNSKPSPDPDFLWTLLALAHFMRLSLTKAAHADVGGAPCRKSGEGLGDGRQNCGALEARHYLHSGCRASGARTMLRNRCPSPPGLG